MTIMRPIAPASRGTQARLAAIALVAVLCAGCASAGKVADKPPSNAGGDKTEDIQPKNVNPMLAPVAPDYFMPSGEFDQNGNRSAAQAAAISAQPTTVAPVPFVPRVLVYHSQASASYFKRGGVDGVFNTFVWERFLRKYRMPYRVLRDASALAQAQTGVLVLPSDVALSAAEREAIADFRRRGGSVFASWMVGTRDESGTWQGFGYMESLLGIRVAGNTATDEEQRYLNPYADTEVTHSVSAGSRIWTERADGYWILRVAGRQHAALVTNWARQMPKTRIDTTIAYDDMRMPNGASSRMVYFGWPERLWLAADPRKHEALLFDSMMWLLRQPSAYLATWPGGLASAYMPLIYMADVFNDNDLPFANQLKKTGLRGSYYVLAFDLDKSSDALKKIQALGHVLGYEGDAYEGFKGLPREEQAARMQKMRADIAALKLPISPDPGFAPPMDDIDANTIAAAAAQPFGHMVAWIGGTDGCVPYFSDDAAGVARGKPLVMLPRIHPGAEEMLEEVDEDAAIEQLRTEIDASNRMGCLSIVRFANQSLLSSVAKDALLGEYTRHKPRMWGTTGNDIARWWLARERIKVDLSGTLSDATLTVDIGGSGPLGEDAVVWLNFPAANAEPVLSPMDGAPALKVAAKTESRAAYLLRGLPAGQHRWSVRFPTP